MILLRMQVGENGNTNVFGVISKTLKFCEQTRCNVYIKFIYRKFGISIKAFYFDFLNEQ